MHRRTSWILVTSLAVLVAVAAIGAKAAVPASNLAKTLDAQRRLAAERPQDPAVYNDLGNLLVLASKPDEAEAAYRKAIELDPGKASAQFNLGLLLQQRGELREASRLYEGAIKAEPGHAWAHYQLGTIQETWGQESKAVGSYAQAFALDPQLAFPEVNPHVIENKLVTQAMMRAYKNDFVVPQVPKVYDDPGRIASLLVPAPAPNAADKDQVAAGQQQNPKTPAANANRPPATRSQVPGATVLRERDLNRGSATGQAAPPGAARGGVRQVPGAYPQQGQPRGLREWNRPEPTVQEVPEDNGVDESVRPQPVITPPPGGVYYRPGVQSTGRLNLQLVPERSRVGRG